MDSDASSNSDLNPKDDQTLGTASSINQSVASSKKTTEADQGSSGADENGSVQADQLPACFSRFKVFSEVLSNGLQIRLEVYYSGLDQGAYYAMHALGATIKDVKNIINGWVEGPPGYESYVPTDAEKQALLQIFDQKRDPSWPSGDESLP